MSRLQTGEGGCLCGSVRYAVQGDPISSTVCHCRSCRRASAAPSVGWVTFRRDRFRLLAGVLRGYASSAGVTRSFCEACGTPIMYESSALGDAIDVTTVSLDDATRHPPTREIWLEHRLDWAACNDAIEHYPRGSDEGIPGAA